MTTKGHEKSNSVIGIIVQINLSFLRTFLFGFFAWMSWPNNLAEYGWTMLAIVMASIVISELVNAFKNIIKLYSREKLLAEYTKQGEAPKTSTLASHHQLDDAGMR